MLPTEGPVGVAQDRDALVQHLPVGVAAPDPVGVADPAFSGEVLALPVLLPVLPAVVLVERPSPADVQVPPVRRTSPRRRTPRIGARPGCRTPRAATGGAIPCDSERPSASARARRSLGAPRRRSPPATRAMSSRLQDFEWSAASVSTTRSRRPRSRAQASKASAAVTNGRPSRRTIGTGWVWRHTTRPLRRIRPDSSGTDAKTGRSWGRGGSHQPKSRAAVRPVNAPVGGSTSCQASRSGRGPSSSSTGRCRPWLTDFQPWSLM